VLVGAVGAVGGVLASSASSAILQPIFGWLIMWLLNLSTGIAQVAMGPAIPESVRFLHRVGRLGEAAHAMRRFGFTLTTVAEPDPAPVAPQPTSRDGSLALALTLAALAWRLVNFGFPLWLPSTLAERGHNVS